MHLFRSIDAAGSNQRTFLLLFSLLFRPQNRLTPQHEKIAGLGNVFVLSFKVARYVLYDDTIISVRSSTNDNDINNNYNIYITR